MDEKPQYLFNVSATLEDTPFFKHIQDNRENLINEYNSALSSDSLVVTSAEYGSGDWNAIWANIPKKWVNSCPDLFPTIKEAMLKDTGDFHILSVYFSILSPDIRPHPHTDTTHLMGDCQFKRYHFCLSIPEDSYLALDDGNGDYYKNYWEEGEWMAFTGLFVQHYPMNENKEKPRVVILVDTYKKTASEECLLNYYAKQEQNYPEVVLDIEGSKVAI